MEIFDKVVSLGYNCYPRMYVNFCEKKADKTCFFDDIATPAWAIQQLLENDFNGFFDQSKYVKKRIFNDSELEFLMNERYYIRFDNKYNINALDNLFNTFQSKKDKLLQLLNSTQKILFIRYEEPTTNNIPRLGTTRIIYDEYASYYSHNELYYMQQLSSYLQTTYPNLDFHILFIGNSMNSTVQLSYDENSKIFTIPNQDIGRDNHRRTLNQLFNDYCGFIRTNCGFPEQSHNIEQSIQNEQTKSTNLYRINRKKFTN